MPPLSKPHASWKPKLPQHERESTWAKAAGEGKSTQQHRDTRFGFIRKANEDSVKSKNGIGLTSDDITVLKKKQIRVSKQASQDNAYRKKPGNFERKKASTHAWLQKPGNREKQNALLTVHKKAKRDALQAEREVEFKANGGSRTTDFGLGDVLREDELKIGAYNIMQNPAGVLHANGEATTANWIKDHGTKSIEEVLATKGWAAYFFITKQKITPGKEIKCVESTNFMSYYLRDPLWRIDTVDNSNQCDFRCFTHKEAKTVVYSYILAKSISAYDATGLEGALQRYIENMGVQHGLCLHREAGAGSRVQYGKKKPETTWVALSLIRVNNPKFADVDPSDAGRSPPLTSCTVTSHNGETTYNVSVRSQKHKFPDSKSVVADEAKITATRLKNTTRRNKRKADALSTSEEDKLSE